MVTWFTYLRNLLEGIIFLFSSEKSLHVIDDIKLFILVGWGRSFLSVDWPTGVQLFFFSFAPELVILLILHLLFGFNVEIIFLSIRFDGQYLPLLYIVFKFSFYIKSSFFNRWRPCFLVYFVCVIPSFWILQFEQHYRIIEGEQRNSTCTESGGDGLLVLTCLLFALSCRAGVISICCNCLQISCTNYISLPKSSRFTEEQFASLPCTPQNSPSESQTCIKY